MAYSLKYSYNPSSQSYTVTGYSDITIADKVVIPSTHDDGTNGSHPVTSIGARAFTYCTSLTSVTIGNGVTSIGGSAFESCSKLTSVTIGNGVTSIGDDAFYRCNSLKQLILFPLTPPTLSSSAIPSTISKIYTQQFSKAAYQAAANWAAFASKVVADNIYLSFVRFNQKNKEYINSRLSLSDIYPVGSIYLSVNSTSPASLFGGVWERIQDRFLLAAGDTYTAGSTGGSADAVVVRHGGHVRPSDVNSGIATADWEVAPNSSNSYYMHIDKLNAYGDSRPFTKELGNEVGFRTLYKGESGAGKNMPPYLTVYMWKRIA